SLPCLISVFRAAAGALLGAAFLWRRQVDARAPRFGETDRDRLLRRARAMLAAPDLLHLLADEFAGLRRRGFALPLVAPRPLDRCLPGHDDVSFNETFTAFNALTGDLIR